MVNLVKPQFDVAAIARNPRRAEEVVPQREGNAVVDAEAICWQVFHMVPDVHLGVVEDVFQWPQWEIDVGMVQVADQNGEQVNEYKILNAKPNHGQWDVLDASVDNGLAEMITQVRRVSHLPDGVVNLVYFPQKRHPVQQAVYVPLDKVTDDEESQQLRPIGQLSHVDGHKIADAKDLSQKLVEGFHRHIRERCVTHQTEQEEVEKHVKRVQPEIFPNGRLIFAPRKQQFKYIHQSRNGDEPVKIIAPVWVQHLMPQVSSVARETVDESIEVGLHVFLLQSWGGA